MGGEGLPDQQLGATAKEQPLSLTELLRVIITWRYHHLVTPAIGALLLPAVALACHFCGMQLGECPRFAAS